jgi:SAM-dependent methyltransferase
VSRAAPQAADAETDPEAWERTPPPAELLARGAPRIASEPVPRCPVCGGARYDAYAVGFDYELLTCANPWRFVACRDCGHVRLHPRPAAEALPVIYPPTYYAYTYDETIHPLARRAKELLDRRKLSGIAGALGRPLGSYLDVGCGQGRFLRRMEERGVPRSRIFGLELDAGVVARLRGEGFQASCARADEDAPIPEASIDLATIFHVIEHVADPGRAVANLARWLSPGGILALETPNLDALDARLFRDTWWGGYHIPRHWHLFTPDTLRRLLEAHGLRVERMRFVTGHSFWMYSFHHRLRYGRRPRPALARRFDPFRGVPLLAAFTAFDLARAALGFRTSSVLVLARRP